MVVFLCRVLLVRVERGSFCVRKNFWSLFEGVDVFVVVDGGNRVRGVCHWGGDGVGHDGNGVFLVDGGNYGSLRLFGECIPMGRVAKLGCGDKLFLFWLRRKWLLDSPVKLEKSVRGVRWASCEECELIFTRFIGEYCIRERISFRSVLFGSSVYRGLYEYCFRFGLEGFLFSVVREGGLFNSCE